MLSDPFRRGAAAGSALSPSLLPCPERLGEGGRYLWRPGAVPTPAGRPAPFASAFWSFHGNPDSRRLHATPVVSLCTVVSDSLSAGLRCSLQAAPLCSCPPPAGHVVLYSRAAVGVPLGARARALPTGAVRFAREAFRSPCPGGAPGQWSQVGGGQASVQLRAGCPVLEQPLLGGVHRWGPPQARVSCAL